MPDLLDAAVLYATEGRAVFPLQPKGKTPATVNGFKNATKDIDKIRDYWSKNPTANVGIATGALSGIVVIDIDNLESATHLGFMPKTMTARTGSGGMHLIFEHPGTEVTNRAGVIEGIDVRGDGGYIVAPPSIHPSGGMYEWLDHRDPAPLPAHLLELIVKKPSVTAPPAEYIGTGVGTAWGQAALEGLLDELRMATPGTRNDTLNRIAWRAFGMVKGGQLSHGPTEEALRYGALALGLDRSEVDATLRSAMQGSEPKGPSEKLPTVPVVEKKPTGPIKVLSRADLETVKPPEYLIADICTTGFTVMYGPSGSGKSFVALDWACHVVTGTKWFNRSSLRRKAIYVAAEGVSGIPRRVNAWEQDRGHRADDFVLIPQAVNLLTSEAQDLAAIVTEQRAGLLVVDTLARSMPGGDENAAQDMGKLIDSLTRIQNDAGCAILLIHHSGVEGRRPRGSTALFGAADTVVRVDKTEDTIKVSCEKQKDDEEFAPWHLRMKPVEGSIVLTLGNTRHLQDTETFILSSLETSPPQTWTELVRLAHGDSSAVASLLNKHKIREAGQRSGVTTYELCDGAPLEGFAR